MLLLFFYLALALGVSFICSLCEASLLSVSTTHATIMKREGKRAGKLLLTMKEHIDRPLAAILTLNTASHTIGAAGVGAESLKVFASVPVAVTSALLTLAILIFSEIIPKTIGAVYCRPLATPVTYMVQAMIWGTYPIIRGLDAMSRLIKRGAGGEGYTREQIAVVAELGRAEGALRGVESRIIQNLLRLNQIQVEDVMTPRTVVFMLQKDTTVDDVLEEEQFGQFSRIPIYDDSPDDMIGVVIKSDIYEASRNGNGDTPVSALVRPMHAVPETAPLLRVLEEFGRLGHHIFLVVDEYGGTSGIVTLEDVFESVIGSEIVDETDLVADLRRLASP